MRDDLRPPTRIELFALDIDSRLAEIWVEFWRDDDIDTYTLGPALRNAYGMGYRDALTEQPRGALFSRHGFDVPPAEGAA